MFSYATKITKFPPKAFTIKKETRGSLLSTGFYIALILNYRSGMSLWLTVAQTSLGNIGEVYVQTLDQPPFKFFGSTFLERKVENRVPTPI